MTSISKRPVDLLIVVCLCFFFLIALTIDFTQAVYGPILNVGVKEAGIWPPAFILKMYAWWSETYDPLLAKNPMWFETMSWFSPILYAPFYAFAIYAFICEKEWIRVPALMWAYGLLLTMFVIAREELFGEYATPDPLIFVLAYSAYVFIPVLIMFRVAWTPVFPSKKKNKNQ